MGPEEHANHMATVEQGLNAILQSEDINEIKSIAQSLLGAEQQEAAEPVVQPSFQDKLAQASGVNPEVQ